MNIDLAELLGSLRYPGIFQLAGALMIGWAIRRWRHGFSLEPMFFFFWGAAFVLISLAMAWDILGKIGMPCLVLLDLPLMIGIILLIAFIHVEFPEEFQSKDVSTIAWGGFALIIGLLGSVLAWQSNPLESLIITVLFVGGGVIAMIKGLRSLLRDK